MSLLHVYSFPSYVTSKTSLTSFWAQASNPSYLGERDRSILFEGQHTYKVTKALSHRKSQFWGKMIVIPVTWKKKVGISWSEAEESET
jgi:hypothetical protein